MRHAELHRIFHGFKRPPPQGPLLFQEEKMNRRHSDKALLASSAGWKYQVSHWLAWLAAIVQALPF